MHDSDIFLVKIGIPDKNIFFATLQSHNMLKTAIDQDKVYHNLEISRKRVLKFKMFWIKLFWNICSFSSRVWCLIKWPGPTCGHPHKRWHYTLYCLVKRPVTPLIIPALPNKTSTSLLKVSALSRNKIQKGQYGRSFNLAREIL